ncbi:MAG: phosphatase PAP2 family protein [Treponema sp.]|nr:phosphatase PAP2 family protein [Candidatus Treponema merdequi]
MKKFFSLLFISILTIAAFADGYTIRNKNEVNSFDQIFMTKYSKTQDYISTGLEITGLVFPAVCLMAPKEDWLEIGVTYAETMAVAFGLRCLFKSTEQRARPYLYCEGAPQKEIDKGDAYKSFMSGHSIMTFAAAGFTTFTFLRYCSDSEWTAPVIAATWTIALATATLRITSGCHFMSDVLSGAAVGTAVGFLIPLMNSLWFEPALKNSPIELKGNGVALKFKW